MIDSPCAAVNVTETTTTTINATITATTTTANSADQASGFILKLYEMITGAPDELIRWTPAGDAFIIGSDLNRLESETLPYYFRHNRFQSLVRQLNFYSFRKVNRERNVWIYKHKLFHRDRPEDLYLVRRRTCPGVDGRKQRFSRLSARKLSRQVGAKAKNSNSSDEDDSSIEEAVAEVVDVADDASDDPAKIELSGADVISHMKRSRRCWIESAQQQQPSVVDFSAIATPPSFESPTGDRFKPDHNSEEDDASTAGKSSVTNKRLEMAQQSLVVSEVAMKLEEYAKKAMKVSGTSRTRRGGLGIVTPPFGASSHGLSTRGLITYDDEYETNSDCTRRSSSSSAGVVSVGDESSVNDDERSPRVSSSSFVNKRNHNNSCKTEPTETITGRVLFSMPPVEDPSLVKKITDEILQAASTTPEHSGPWIASAAVAGFCMGTPPNIDDESAISNKILHLIASCPNLATEFQQYRAALHPQERWMSESPLSQQQQPHHPSSSIYQDWERSACRVSAVRDFKTFAVNAIHNVMSRIALGESDTAALEHTADVWLKSVGGNKNL